VKKLNRVIFENAISTMKKHGMNSILSSKMYNKREIIRKSLLLYYESTEEFEKCKYIKDFFEELELQDPKIRNKEPIGATGEGLFNIDFLT
jgi:hypothetical protein